MPITGESVKGYEATGWQGLFAPAGTPRPIVDKVAAEVKRIFEAPDVVTALRNVGAEPAPLMPEEFAAFAQAERAKWRKVVEASGLQPQCRHAATPRTALPDES